MPITKMEVRLLAGFSVLNAALLGFPSEADAGFDDCDPQVGECHCVFAPFPSTVRLCVGGGEVETCHDDEGCNEG